MVVPFAAGRPAGTPGRTIAQAMTVQLKQTAIIAGAGGAEVSFYATPCFLNHASIRFQPSSAASLR